MNCSTGERLLDRLDTQSLYAFLHGQSDRRFFSINMSHFGARCVCKIKLQIVFYFTLGYGFGAHEVILLG